MDKVVIRGVVCVTAMFMVTGGRAEPLGPGPADIVMECVRDNQPSEICQFSCGNELAQPPGGKQVTWGNVSRVEIYNKGSTGRTDTRSWVFVAYKPAANPSAPPNVASLYLGPRYFCLGNTLVDGQGKKIELRITKFQFN
jgi:ribosomal protein S27E